MELRVAAPRFVASVAEVEPPSVFHAHKAVSIVSKMFFSLELKNVKINPFFPILGLLLGYFTIFVYRVHTWLIGSRYSCFFGVLPDLLKLRSKSNTSLAKSKS